MAKQRAVVAEQQRQRAMQQGTQIDGSRLQGIVEEEEEEGEGGDNGGSGSLAVGGGKDSRELDQERKAQEHDLLLRPGMIFWLRCRRVAAASLTALFKYDLAAMHCIKAEAEAKMCNEGVVSARLSILRARLCVLRGKSDEGIGILEVASTRNTSAALRCAVRLPFWE